MLCAICFRLDQSKILSSANGLMHLENNRRISANADRASLPFAIFKCSTCPKTVPSGHFVVLRQNIINA